MADVQPAADPAEQRARVHAERLYTDIAVAYNISCERCPIGTARAMIRVALPYSIKQLSEWLSRGGMSQGAPPPMLAGQLVWPLNILSGASAQLNVFSQRVVSCDLGRARELPL